MDSVKTLFIIAGERSGDNLAAALIRALRAAGATPDKLRIIGIGGEACEREGLTSLFPMDDLAVMGFQEILPALPRILSRLKQTKHAIKDAAPDMLLTVDSPGFSFRVAKAFPKEMRWADGRAMRKWHYVAPSVWAYKPGRAKKTARLYYHLLTLLPFEPPYFTKEGMSCDFIGHSAMTADNAPPPKAPELPQRLRPSGANARIIAVMPGSRRGEINRIGPALCGALEIISRDTVIAPYLLIPKERYADTQALLAQFPALQKTAVLITEKDDIQQIRYHADICLLKSGTVSLEQCLFGTPALVVYKASAITAWMIRRMLLIPYASLPNLLLEQEIIPELIQETCTPEHIAETALSFLRDADKATAQTQALATVPPLLGAGDTQSPAEKAAARIINTLSLVS